MKHFFLLSSLFFWVVIAAAQEPTMPEAKDSLPDTPYEEPFPSEKFDVPAPPPPAEIQEAPEPPEPDTPLHRYVPAYRKPFSLKEDLLSHTAIGFYNLSGGNSKYYFMGSYNFELGFKIAHYINKKNSLRFNYALLWQFNSLSIKNNQHFVINNNQTLLASYANDTSVSKLRMHNLVLPLHIEFNLYPNSNVHYYSYRERIKLGIGVYGSLSLDSSQKMKYSEDEVQYKIVTRKDLGINQLSWGGSAYLGYKDVAVYVRYAVMPLFANGGSQYPFSFGIQF